MPTTHSNDERKRDPVKPLSERAGRRSSPGSGEDEDEAADLQPEEVENGEPSR